VWICTGNELAKFHGNILSISENIAKSFRGGLLFLTHTVYVAFSYILNQNLYGFNRNRIFEKSIHSVLTVVSLHDLVFYDHYCLSVCLSVCVSVCLFFSLFGGLLHCRIHIWPSQELWVLAWSSEKVSTEILSRLLYFRTKF